MTKALGLCPLATEETQAPSPCYDYCSKKQWEMKISDERFGNLNNSFYLCTH